MPKAHDGSEDQFGAAANFYAAARPSYPTELVDHFVSKISNRKSALDVAAGSGQLSVLLADHFDEVIAMDKSQEQLEHGQSRPNITYSAGVATHLPSKSNSSFDAVTCAQAYHWFVADGESDRLFLEETRRVLDPNHGRLGIFGYGVCSITSSPSLEKIFKDFYHNDLGSRLPPSSPDCHWNIDRRLLDSGLEGISTHGAMEVVERLQHIQRRKMTPHLFLDYIRSFSSLSSLRKQCASQGEMDPLEKLHIAFEANTGGEEVLDVDFPFFLLIMKPAQT